MGVGADRTAPGSICDATTAGKVQRATGRRVALFATLSVSSYLNCTRGPAAPTRTRLFIVDAGVNEQRTRPRPRVSVVGGRSRAPNIFRCLRRFSLSARRKGWVPVGVSNRPIRFRSEASYVLEPNIITQSDCKRVQKFGESIETHETRNLNLRQM